MPCNLEPSTKRHKAQARIALLFSHALIAFSINPDPQTCTPPSKNDIFRYLWRLMHILETYDRTQSRPFAEQ